MLEELRDYPRKIGKSMQLDIKLPKSETVFLRWTSVSSEFIDWKRPYIHEVTRVKPEWLARYSIFCSFSAPLTDPKSYYEPRTDQIYNWVSVTFGDSLWQLALHSLPVKDEKLGVNVFCYSLLDSIVLPYVKRVLKFMASQPATILKPEALGHKRFGKLLYELRKRRINSFAMLRIGFKTDPK